LGKLLFLETQKGEILLEFGDLLLTRFTFLPGIGRFLEHFEGKIFLPAVLFEREENFFFSQRWLNTVRWFLKREILGFKNTAGIRF